MPMGIDRGKIRFLGFFARNVEFRARIFFTAKTVAKIFMFG